MAKALRRTLIIAAAAALPVGAIIGINMTNANAASGFPAHYAAPYLELSSGTAGDMAADMKASTNKYYTLAFIIPKSGCTPEWEAGPSGLNAFVSQVKTLQNAGGQVIISNGGAAPDGTAEMATKCTDVASLESVYLSEATTYGTNRLDFDVEGGTLSNSGANSRRAQALAKLQKDHPNIEVDFTVAVDPGGMPSQVTNMLKQAVSAGVKINLVNIMTMDFGDGQNALNDGLSASKAAHSQIQSILGVSSAQAWAKLGATFIAGKNDDNENFTQGNAQTYENFAAQNGVGELSFWEVDSYDKKLGYAYSKIFTKITGGTPPTSTPPTTKPPTSPPPGSTTIQAENATLSNAVVATNHTGFTGSGFVDYAAQAGSFVQFSVSRSAAGSAKLTLRYANGSTANRPASLIVNGTTVSTLTFGATTDWNTWTNATATVTLKSGTNTIRVSATTAPGGPNLDSLTVA
jgi:chitinase